MNNSLHPFLKILQEHSIWTNSVFKKCKLSLSLSFQLKSTKDVRRAFLSNKFMGFVIIRNQENFLFQSFPIHRPLLFTGPGVSSKTKYMEPGVGLTFILLIFISSCSCSSKFYLLKSSTNGLIPDTCGGENETLPTWNTCFKASSLTERSA